jgi:hypothetical protein
MGGSLCNAIKNPIWKVAKLNNLAGYTRPAEMLVLLRCLRL